METGVREVTVDDALARWSLPLDWELTASATEFRQELGIPIDRPVVMTGHQPTFWHPGILAKYLAVDAVAEKTGAAMAWCVPDQDVVDPGSVQIPTRVDADHQGSGSVEGHWERIETRLLRWNGSIDKVPVGTMGAGRTVSRAVLPSSLESLITALESAEGNTAARRVWSAHGTVLRDRLGLTTGPETPVAFATDVGRTTLFHGFVEMMRADPAACTETYNEAVRSEPGVGMRPLAVSDDRDNIELPLWRTSPEGRRVGVFASDLGSLSDLDHAGLLPRASMFTGMLRLAGCDLFIHGTGGIGYDRVTERWFKDWLGNAMGGTHRDSLAPSGVATATVLLDLGIPQVTGTDLARAIWHAHAGRHTPLLLGDEQGQTQKDRLVSEIASATPSQRAPLFRDLHALLAKTRVERADELDELNREVRTIRAAIADRGVATDRTWPWVLHHDRDITALRHEIAGRVRGEGAQ